MSLAYKLFSIPKTLNEIADKAKKTKTIPEISIHLMMQPTLVPGPEYPYICKTKIKVGNTRLTLFKSPEFYLKHHNRLDSPENIPYHPSISLAKHKAYEIARLLFSKGIIATLNGNAFENSKN